MVWSCYSRRLLLVTAPVLLLMELATLAMSIAQGWQRHKIDAWRWLWANRRHVHARRQSVQATRVVRDRAVAAMFATKLNPGNLPPPAWTGPLDRVLGAYWALARRLL